MIREASDKGHLSTENNLKDMRVQPCSYLEIGHSRQRKQMMAELDSHTLQVRGPCALELA